MKTKRGLPDMTWIPEKKLWRKRGTYKGHKYEKTGLSPEIVLEKIEAFKAKIDAGSTIDDSITLTAYALRWYPARVAGLKPKSKEAISNVLDNHILPKLGEMRLKEIKPLHIDDLMAGLAGYSSSLSHKTLSTLKRIFASANENGIIAINPCLSRSAGGLKPKRKTPLTIEQQETLTKAVRGTRAELFTLLCLYTGLRREEALGLLWSSIQLDAPAPFLVVENTVTFDTGGRPIHSPVLKSLAAFRTIPLSPQLTEALGRWRSVSSGAFVVPSVASGKEMSKNAFRRMWELVVGHKSKVAKRNGEGNKVLSADGRPVMIKKHYPGLIGFHVEPHVLRHTYITRLCASGMDIKKIQYLAGHATVQMTLDIYTHVTQNQPEELAPDIQKAFGGTNGGT